MSHTIRFGRYLALQTGFLVFSFACFPTGPTETAIETTISGVTQKGPFVSGSGVDIQELNSSLVPNGTVFQTTTSDDLGAFSVASTFGTSVVEVAIQGFYFDEVGNALSGAPLTLRAIAEIGTNAPINVNVLTTLQRSRAGNLVGQGMDIPTALQAAGQDVLRAFYLDGIDVGTLSTLNLAGVNEGDAILVAVSAVLQQVAHERAGQPSELVAALSEFLAQLSTDLDSDGVVDDAANIAAISDASEAVDLLLVRANLEARFTSLGQSTVLAPFEDYVDSDGDGVVNKDDPSPWQQRAPLPSARRPFGLAEYAGRILAFGGSGPTGNLSDVLEYDPVADRWTTVVDSLAALNRRPRIASVGQRVYLIGGFQGSGNASLAVDEYDPQLGTITPRASLPAPTTSTSEFFPPIAVGMGGRIWAFGSPLDSTVEYDPVTDQWTKVAAAPAIPGSIGRNDTQWVATGGKVYVGSWISSATVLTFDVATGQWSSVASMPERTWTGGAAEVGGKIFAIGGCCPTDRFQYYDIASNTWTLGRPLSFPRSGPVIAIGDVIYAVGGVGILGGSQSQSLDRVDAYTPALDDELSPQTRRR